MRCFVYCTLEKSGVHPIAVRKKLRRLIAKCLVNEAKSEATESSETYQLGVGVSGGAEAKFHFYEII